PCCSLCFTLPLFKLLLHPFSNISASFPSSSLDGFPSPHPPTMMDPMMYSPSSRVSFALNSPSIIFIRFFSHLLNSFLVFHAQNPFSPKLSILHPKYSSPSNW